MEIADEEIVHAGELLRLLKELSPREETLYAQGAQEVQEQITLMNSPLPTEQVQEPLETAPTLTVGSLIDSE
jgi:rubrerythrin